MARRTPRIVLAGLAMASMAFRPAAGQLRDLEPPPPPPPEGPALALPGKATLKRRVVGPAAGGGQVVPAPKAQFELRPLPPQLLQVPRVVNREEARKNQWLLRLRPVFRGDYLFARTVCRLTPKERTEIALRGERALRATVDEAGASNNISITGESQARERILAALADAIAECVPAERRAQYASEVEARAADFKDATTRYYIARLDQELGLSARQREDIAAALKGVSGTGWSPTLDAGTPAVRTYGPIPIKALKPILTKTQFDALLRFDSEPRQAIAPAMAFVAAPVIVNRRPGAAAGKMEVPVNAPVAVNAPVRVNAPVPVIVNGELNGRVVMLAVSLNANTKAFSVFWGPSDVGALIDGIAELDEAEAALAPPVKRP